MAPPPSSPTRSRPRSTSPRSTPSGAALAKKRKRRPSGSLPPAGSRPKATRTSRPTARARTPQPADRRPWGVGRFVAIAVFIALGWLLFFRTPGPGEVSAEARSAAQAAGCGDLEQPVVPNPSRVHLAPGESFDYPHTPRAAGPPRLRDPGPRDSGGPQPRARLRDHLLPPHRRGRAGPGDDRPPSGDRPRRGPRGHGPGPLAPGRPGVRAPRLEQAVDVPGHDLGGPGGHDDDVVHRRVPRNLGRAGGAARAARPAVPEVAAAGLGDGAGPGVGGADADTDT